MSKSKTVRVCPKCGGVNDSKSGAYCKRCNVSYQRERRQINAGTKCAAPRCNGRRPASSAYCKACTLKHGRKYKRKLFAEMTRKELAEFRRKKAEYNRKRAAEMTSKERAEQNRRKRETARARYDRLTEKEQAELKRKQRKYQRVYQAAHARQS